MPIKRAIQECDEQLCAHKSEILDEMVQLLETHHLSNLTEEETGDLNMSVSIKEVE